MSTILLVEDNPHIMKINAEALTLYGYEVLQAATAKACRQAMEWHPVDLVVLDIMLPDGDGVQLCRELKENYRVPILFLSALGESRDVVEGLRALCAPHGIAVTVVEMAQYGGRTVSSTRIRAALEEGRLDDANVMLGAPYAIDWTVRHGRGIGTSRLGTPTINQNYPAGTLQPCCGVYLTRIRLQGRWWPAATGISRRPTVEAAGAPVSCETYVPGFSGDVYGQNPTLEFHKYLCPVRKFSSLQALADLITTAAAQSCAYFRAVQPETADLQPAPDGV